MNVTCSPSTILNYSRLCLGLDGGPDSLPPPDDCFPAKDEPRNMLANVLQLANLVVGIHGNMLTLVAIPYAMYRRK